MADCEKCLFRPNCTRTNINANDGYCWLYDKYEGEELKRVVCNTLWLMGFNENE